MTTIQILTYVVIFSLPSGAMKIDHGELIVEDCKAAQAEIYSREKPGVVTVMVNECRTEKEEK